MLIRCKQCRPGGSFIQLGKGRDMREYHFAPVKGGDPEDHVCDIDHADDIATLLAIKEGYEVHPSEVKSKAKTPTPPASAGTSEKQDHTPSDPADYSTWSKAELIDAVAKRTGKKPHPSTSTAKLIAQLQA